MLAPTIDTAHEVRISRGELLAALEGKYEFLWHFAQKLIECRRCRSTETEEGPYRIYANGYGDFVIYHRCAPCGYPVKSYVDLSQDPNLRQELRVLWLTKTN